jgi:hypothetical protein
LALLPPRPKDRRGVATPVRAWVVVQMDSRAEGPAQNLCRTLGAHGCANKVSAIDHEQVHDHVNVHVDVHVLVDVGAFPHSGEASCRATRR